MPLINIGFGNMVLTDRIIAIVRPNSAPIRRQISNGKDKDIVIDATAGKATRAAIYTDNGYIILSAIEPKTLVERLRRAEDGQSESD